MTDIIESHSSCVRKTLGSVKTASKIASRAIHEVKAYQQVIEQTGIPPSAPFEQLPILDKESHMKRHALVDLLGADFKDTFTVFKSAGTSGHAFYWPQLRQSYAGSTSRMRALLESLFGIQHQNTMAVVGLALGSWIGGDVLSWSLKDVAMSTPYPFAVFSPGNKHDEIIAILHEAASLVDQFLLICCPSAIGHLILRAEQTGKPLPLAKMRYLVIGEPFPEQLRSDIEAQANVAPPGVVIASVYGSADTGVLGFESEASILVRKMCHADPDLARALNVESVTPHFFHMADPNSFLETVDGELCVTKWQGIPLVRYNLHDRATLYDFPAVIEVLSSLPSMTPDMSDSLARMRTAADLAPLPGLIAVAGRADACLILCGTKLSEEMLDDAMRSPELTNTLTGRYQAQVIVENGRQRLKLAVEHKPTDTAADQLDQIVYPRLIRAIGRAQPEFLDDWINIYRNWDNDFDQRILKLDLVAWPAMSQSLEHGIKQHSIIL